MLLLNRLEGPLRTCTRNTTIDIVPNVVALRVRPAVDHFSSIGHLSLHRPRGEALCGSSLADRNVGWDMAGPEAPRCRGRATL
jgi:hypothetical protein